MVGYRAPSFSVTGRSMWALDVLIEEGYTYDTSIFPIRHDRYGIPDAPRHPYWIAHSAAGNHQLEQGAAAEDHRSEQGFSPARHGSILEIPGSTIRLFGANLPVAGGGYFRLLPYWWTRFGIRRVNGTEGKPAVFYIHPWEVDPGQPRLQGSRLSRFRHYRNLAKTESRLRRLLADFTFGPLAEAVRATIPKAA